MPGSALRLLNQGRAQGLFTPSTSSLALLAAGIPGPGGYAPQASIPSGQISSSSPLLPSVSPTPPPMGQALKRSHSQVDDAEASTAAATPIEAPALDSRIPSTTSITEGVQGPNPAKRARTESSPLISQDILTQSTLPVPQLNGSMESGTLVANGIEGAGYKIRFASKPHTTISADPSAPLRDQKRVAILSAIMTSDSPGAVLDAIRRDAPNSISSPSPDIDLIIDDLGHTPLHLAASMARLNTVEALLGAGADVHRGNYHGESPLIRACMALHNHVQNTFDRLIELLHPSIRTLDTARKSVCHHIVALAGVKGRAGPAQYYLDGVFTWITHHEKGDYKSIIDLQDEHGDTPLNIAARVGNRGLVKTLLAMGANRTLPNKLGLRPGDFGVEVEVCQVIRPALLSID
jgi:regulatory protein SWI6